MSWAIGFDSRWDRDIGYAVPAACDHPGCGAAIDRGLSFVCGGGPYGGEHGCGLYFCGVHLLAVIVSLPESRAVSAGSTCQLCERCAHHLPPFGPAPDTREWIAWKLADDSWAAWRDAHPEKTAAMAVAISTGAAS
jgi:hypothetical protein